MYLPAEKAGCSSNLSLTLRTCAGCHAPISSTKKTCTKCSQVLCAECVNSHGCSAGSPDMDGVSLRLSRRSTFSSTPRVRSLSEPSLGQHIRGHEPWLCAVCGKTFVAKAAGRTRNGLSPGLHVAF